MEFYKAEENRYADMIYRRGADGAVSYCRPVPWDCGTTLVVWTCSVILSRSLTPHSIMA